ncbi:8_t:CDS:2 [Paraglomus occultum]|uniref:8_t:CDS:1 n=1 Tax=Paraglomus occultum TaxID=144539 RepID=A0A9N9GHB3_9GLOM|nr:8_t:CDS:2 [Paraglomus occultum]
MDNGVCLDHYFDKKHDSHSPKTPCYSPLTANPSTLNLPLNLNLTMHRGRIAFGKKYVEWPWIKYYQYPKRGQTSRGRGGTIQKWRCGSEGSAIKGVPTPHEIYPSLYNATCKRMELC